MRIHIHIYICIYSIYTRNPHNSQFIGFTDYRSIRYPFNSSTYSLQKDNHYNMHNNDRQPIINTSLTITEFEDISDKPSIPVYPFTKQSQTQSTSSHQNTLHLLLSTPFPNLYEFTQSLEDSPLSFIKLAVHLSESIKSNKQLRTYSLQHPSFSLTIPGRVGWIQSPLSFTSFQLKDIITRFIKSLSWDPQLIRSTLYLLIINLIETKESLDQVGLQIIIQCFTITHPGQMHKPYQDGMYLLELIYKQHWNMDSRRVLAWVLCIDEEGLKSFEVWEAYWSEFIFGKEKDMIVIAVDVLYLIGQK